MLYHLAFSAIGHEQTQGSVLDSFSLSLKHTTAAVEVVPASFTKMTRCVVRSTSMPTAERLLASMMDHPHNGQA